MSGSIVDKCSPYRGFDKKARADYSTIRELPVPANITKKPLRLPPMERIKK